MVAGKVKYRHSDLVLWQSQGETPCQDGVGDPDLSPSAIAAGPKAFTTSAGRKAAAHASVQRAKRTSDALKSLSKTGSQNDDTPLKVIRFQVVTGLILAVNIAVFLYSHVLVGGNG